MSEYKFNPEEYGFEHADNFPELKPFLGNRTYVKIIEISDQERVTFWYKTCRQINPSLNDDRWTFSSNSYQENSDNDRPNNIYSGLISTKEFADMLLKNLCGTTRNDSVDTFGRERRDRNINHLRLTQGIDSKTDKSYKSS